MSTANGSLEIVITFIVLLIFGTIYGIPTDVFGVIDMTAEHITEDDIPKVEGEWGELQEKQINETIGLSKLLKFSFYIIGLVTFFLAVMLLCRRYS